MIQLIEILIMISDEREYFEIFVSNQAHILVSVCMNLMQTMSSEAELIMSDPTEFMGLCLDCCDKQ